MIHYVRAFFRGIAARSMDRAFVSQSLAHQLQIARVARTLDDRSRVLFDPDFLPCRFIRIGGHHVAVDADGTQAILLQAAQTTFTPEYFYSFHVSEKDVIRHGKRVLLLSYSSDPSCAPPAPPLIPATNGF